MKRLSGEGWKGPDLSIEDLESIALTAVDMIKSSRRPTVVIGSDARLTSRRNSAAVTRSLTGTNVNIVAIDEPVSAPIVGAVMRRVEAEIGIYLTASHRPNDWVGIKIKSTGGCALPHTVANVVDEYARLPVKGPMRSSAAAGRRRVSWNDAANVYLAEIEGMFSFCGSRRRRPVTIVDYGAISSRDLEYLFTCFGQPWKVVRGTPLGRFQDPVTVLSWNVVSRASCPVLAIDPDGDSVGVVDHCPALVAPHAAALAVGMWLARRGGATQCVVQLGAPSALVAALTTLGERCLQSDGSFASICAAPESRNAWICDENGNIGLRFQPPQRDGLLAALCVAENRNVTSTHDWRDNVTPLSSHGYVRESVPAAGLEEVIAMLTPALPEGWRNVRCRRSTLFVSPSGVEWLLLRQSETEATLRIRGELHSMMTSRVLRCVSACSRELQK